MRHVIAVTLVGAFLALGWWQINRAAAGNVLSWAYAVEWPVFAGFVVFLWVREVRHELRGDPQTAPAPTTGTGTGAELTPGADPKAGSGSQAPYRPGPSEAVPRPGIRRPVRSARVPVVDDNADDGDLAAYNHYLSWLNANPGARPSDYPG